MPELGEDLSRREKEILECVVAGSGNKQIAADLHISQNTVKVHLRNVYAKLGVSTRTEAATMAIREGLVAMPQPTESDEGDAAPSTDEPQLEQLEQLEEQKEVEAAEQTNLETAVSTPSIDTEEQTNQQPQVVHHYNKWLVVAGIFLLGFIAIATIIAVSNQAPLQQAEPYEEVILSDNWVQSRPIPVAASKAAAASFGLDLYLIAGEQDGEISNNVYVYDTASREWETKAQKPTAVSEVTAVELGGVIFVPGGRTADGQPSDVVEVYSTASDAWGNVTALPEPTSGGLTLTNGGLIYFIGGDNGTDVLNKIYVYNPAVDSWRPLADMNHARSFASGGIIGNNLYVVGGFDGQSELDVCEVYDLAENSWGSCAPLLTKRGGAGTAVLINKLYIMGGGMEADNPISYSETYDPTIDTWSLVNTPFLTTDDKWANVGVASVENRIYVLGGQRNNDQITNDNLIYAPLIYQTFIPAASAADR